MQIALVEELTNLALATGLSSWPSRCLALSLAPSPASRRPLIQEIRARSSNASRVVLTLGYVVVLSVLHGGWEVLAIYMLSFVMASLARFFYPAEGERSR